MNNHLLKINCVLPEHIMIRCFHRALLCQSYRSNHGYQLQKRPKHLQRRMNPVQGNSQICHSRSRFPPFCPKRRLRAKKIRIFWKRGCTCRRKFCRKNSCPQKTLGLNPGDRVTPALMSQNFSRRNVQKHNHKLKQNCQSTYIDQQLQQNKIFKP